MEPYQPNPDRLLTPDQIQSIPVSWFNTVNRLATALKLNTDRQPLSVNSKALEIDTLQIEILTELYGLPEEIVLAYHYSSKKDKGEMINIFYDYLERWPEPLSQDQIEERYKLPRGYSRDLMNLAINKIAGYKNRDIGIEGDHLRYAGKYRVFIELANALSIPVEEVRPRDVSKDVLKAELLKVSKDIMNVINRTEDEVLTLRDYPIQPDVLRHMIFDYFGLTNIEKPRLKPTEIAARYSFKTAELALSVIEKARKILKKHHSKTRNPIPQTL